MTPVIFRKWKDTKDIIALFPALWWDQPRGLVTSYMHLGQHYGAYYTHIIKDTVPALPSEYEPLLRELERLGYTDLKVRKRR